MLRPPAPDSSEENTQIEISRRLFLAVAGSICAASYTTLRKIYTQLCIPEDDASITSITDTERDRENTSQEIQTKTLLACMQDGESLINQELHVTVTDAEGAERSISFFIRKDANGMCIEIGHNRYRSEYFLINKAIDAAKVQTKDGVKCIHLTTPYYGSAMVPEKEMETIIRVLSAEPDRTEVLVDTSYEKGMLASMLPGALFQKKKLGDRSGYIIAFERDDEPEDRFAQAHND